MTRKINKVAIVFTILFALRTNKSGHAVVAIRYRIAPGYNYLRVIDNWNRNTNRYILFNKDAYRIDGFQGAAVKFKSIS